MTRLPHVAMLLVAVASVAADKGEKKKGDADKIQGKWMVVEYYFKGKSVESFDGMGGAFIFLGKKLTIVHKDRDREGKKGVFELHPDKKPRELDIVFKADGLESTVSAIYEFSGETLKICIVESGKGRPKAIGTAADDERFLLVLKRLKGDKGDDKK